MVKWTPATGLQKQAAQIDQEYLESIRELISHTSVTSMKNFIQHGNVSCLEHCLNVSYRSYVICKKLRRDCRSAARGGLLHDYFLYDWHKDKPEHGLHGFVHPAIALKNAEKYFTLNRREQDIIRKHMWPFTPLFPRYTESWVVTAVDKYCAATESFRVHRKTAKMLQALIPF